MKLTLRFPEKFLWGAATSSFQVEGGIENMDWAKLAQEGKLPAIGKACDHYNRFEQDFDIARSLNHNCHRLSIEWARIEPEEGKFDKKEIEHYRRVLQALEVRNMKPFITLWHFTLPLWLSEKGGFENPKAPEFFARYCAVVVEQLGDLCSEYSTINEAIPFASNGWLRGTWPPLKKWPPMDWSGAAAYTNSLGATTHTSLWNIFTFLSVISNLAKAHNAAYDAIKKIRPDVNVGIVTHVVFFHSNKNPFNKLLARFMNWQFTFRFMNMVHKKCDEIGLNYYMHKKFGDTQTYEKTDMGWDVYPEGITGALLLLKRYGKPIYVSEAGVADAKDTIRANYIRSLVAGIHSAIQQGVNVRGFMYWSLLDNYELAHGYTKRFGLIEIDFVTQERKVRPSALAYKEICETNVLEIDPASGTQSQHS